MQMKFLILMILMFLNITNISLAQNLESYLQEAAENNPELKARFVEYLSSMEKVPQVGALPDPEFTFGVFTRPMELLMGNQRAELTLMQMFPWFGMLRNQRNEAAIMAKATYENFREAKNQLYFEIKESWYRLHQIHEEIKITEENLEILRSIERMALVRFQSAEGGSGGSQGNMSGTGRPSSINPQRTAPSGMGGMGSMGNSSSPQVTGGRSTATMGAYNETMSGSGMAEVLRVQIEIKEIENELETLKEARIHSSINFNTLINRNIDKEIILADTLLPRSLSSGSLVLSDSILDKYPMSQMLDAEIEAFQVQQDMAKLNGLPMMGVGLNYMIFSPRNSGEMGMTGGNNMLMPMIRFSLPIYRKKYKAQLKEAELNKEAVTYRKSSIQNNLMLQWHESINELSGIERKMNLYKEQSELAAQALDIMLTSYAANGSSFEDILRMRQQLLEYRSKLINAVVDQNITIAMLERISTSDLD